MPTLISDDKQFSSTIRCIEQARKNTKVQFHLIIVETLTNYLEDYADEYVHISNKTNIAHDLNVGWKLCDPIKHPYVGYLSNDVFVGEHWVESMLECFDKHPDCGIATTGCNEHHDIKSNKITQDIWCPIFLTKTKLLKLHGYFDEKLFPVIWNDTDYIMRLATWGYLPYKNHNCISEHKVGMTLYSNPKYKKWYQESGELFNEIYKNCGHPLYDVLKLR